MTIRIGEFVIKVLVIPDSFKNSLTSTIVTSIISKGLKRHFPFADIIELPFADGGEGTTELLYNKLGGRLIEIHSTDPLNRSILTSYLIYKDNNTAFIEIAKCSGIQLLKKSELNPFLTSTYGTGLLIKNAIEKGCKKIIVGVGGSATNDYGVGLLNALGVNFYSATGKIEFPGCEDLSNIINIDTDKFNSLTKNIKFSVITDVENCITGPNGATFTFASQKGASQKELEIIENKMLNFTSFLEDKFKKNISSVPRTGAGGGISAGLFAFLNSELLSGAEYLANIFDLEKTISNCDLIITGEGKIDEQSFFGKGPYYIASLAKKYQKEVIAFTGQNCVTDNTKNIFDNIIETNKKNYPLTYSLRNANELLEIAVNTYFCNRKNN